MSKPAFDPRLHLLEEHEDYSWLRLSCGGENLLKNAKPARTERLAFHSSENEIRTGVESQEPSELARPKSLLNATDDTKGNNREIPRRDEGPRLTSHSNDTGKGSSAEQSRHSISDSPIDKAVLHALVNDARQALRTESRLPPVSQDDDTVIHANIMESNSYNQKASTSHDVVTVTHVTQKIKSRVPCEQIDQDEPGRRTPVSGKQKPKKPVNREKGNEDNLEGRLKDLVQRSGDSSDRPRDRCRTKQFLEFERSVNIMDQAEFGDTQEQRSKSESNISNDKALAFSLQGQDRRSKSYSQVDDEAFAHRLFEQNIVDAVGQLGSEGGGQGQPSESERSIANDEALACNLFDQSIADMILARTEGATDTITDGQSSDEDAKLALRLMALEAKSRMATVDTTTEKDLEIAKKMQKLELMGKGQINDLTKKIKNVIRSSNGRGSSSPPKIKKTFEEQARRPIHGSPPPQRAKGLVSSSTNAHRHHVDHLNEVGVGVKTSTSSCRSATKTVRPVRPPATTESFEGSPMQHSNLKSHVRASPPGVYLTDPLHGKKKQLGSFSQKKKKSASAGTGEEAIRGRNGSRPSPNSNVESKNDHGNVTKKGKTGNRRSLQAEADKALEKRKKRLNFVDVSPIPPPPIIETEALPYSISMR